MNEMIRKHLRDLEASKFEEEISVRFPLQNCHLGLDDLWGYFQFSFRISDVHVCLVHSSLCPLHYHSRRTPFCQTYTKWYTGQELRSNESIYSINSEIPQDMLTTMLSRVAAVAPASVLVCGELFPLRWEGGTDGMVEIALRDALTGELYETFEVPGEQGRAQWVVDKPRCSSKKLHLVFSHKTALVGSKPSGAGSTNSSLSSSRQCEKSGDWPREVSGASTVLGVSHAFTIFTPLLLTELQFAYATFCRLYDLPMEVSLSYSIQCHDILCSHSFCIALA